MTTAVSPHICIKQRIGYVPAVEPNAFEVGFADIDGIRVSPRIGATLLGIVVTNHISSPLRVRFGSSDEDVPITVPHEHEDIVSDRPGLNFGVLREPQRPVRRSQIHGLENASPTCMSA